MSPDEQSLRDLHAAWIAAVNAGDLARLLTLMTDDVVYISPGQAPFGRSAFAAHFPAAHQEAQIHCRSDLEEVLIAADIACTRSRDTLTVTPRAGGEPTHFAGHRMTLYRKQPDGRWLLARDAHTVLPQ